MLKKPMLMLLHSSNRQLLAAACMIIQLVPSDTSAAQSPVDAARMAVAAAPPAKPTTLLDADTKVCAWVFLKFNCRPVLVEGVGKVTVQVEPDLLLMNQVSPAPTVKSAVLVMGADVAADSVPAEKVRPVPTVTLLNPPEPLPYRMDVPLVAGA
jgi:hypothetical protein